MASSLLPATYAVLYALGAMMRWFEQGIAPDSLTATGRSFPGRSRPLCAYPKHAQYNGSGDTQDARNFQCQGSPPE